MKTKLLKKVKKRFSWGWSKTEKRWVIADHEKQTLTFIDKQFVHNYFGNEDKPECGWYEMKFRLLKRHILSPFIHRPIEKIMYRAFNNKLKKLKHKKNDK
jgi:hypothetical protein